MKKLIYIVFSVLGILTVASCGRNVKSNNWGKSVYYKDFLFKKCPSDTLTKTLVVSFNEESMKMPQENSDLHLSLYKVLDNGSICKVSSDEAVLLINDKPAENNVFAIAPVEAEQKIRVGVVLSEAFLANIQEDRIVSYMFKVEKNPGYDRLNNLDVSGGATPVLDSFNDDAMQMRVYVELVPNTLKVSVIIASIVILLGLIIWIFMAHVMIWPPTKFSKVLIDYHDGMGERSVRMSGCYQLVLTSNARLKDSILKKIFKGKCKYEVNPFWTHDIILKNSASRTSIRVSNLRTFYINGENVRKQPFEIINDEGKKVTITTT